MSSNPVALTQTTRIHASLRPCKNWRANLLPVLVLALGLGGCALNSTGLPGGLPIPPGGSSISFTRTSLVDGIVGRTYTIFIPTTGGTGTLTTCTIIVGALPTGLSVGVDPGNATRCRITGTVAGTVVPGPFTATVRASDSAVPANTAAQSFTFAIRAEFTITTVTPFLRGVVGRTYGNAPQTPQPVNTNVSATAGNGPLTACTFTIAGNPGFNLTPAPTGTSCPLSSGATLLSTAGPFSVSVVITDNPIVDPIVGGTVVPAATVNNTAAPLSLTVDPILALTLTQTTNATPTAALLNAVGGRNYGTGAQAGGAPTFTATGGLTTNVNFNWCISAGSLPAGFAANPAALSACPTTAAVPVATPVTVTAAAAGAAGGPTGFTLEVSDGGNAAVPSGSVTQGTQLTINPALSLAVNLADPLPDAVVGRTYGGAGFTSVIYTASNGEGAYTFIAPPTGAAPAAGVFPAPMSCAPAATTLTCSSAAITGTVGAYTNAPATVDDAGNAAVPGSAAAAVSATQTRSLNVQAALNFVVNYANPLPTAVNGRTWGTGVGFTPLVYTVQDGLGGYTLAVSGTAFPTGIACATAATTITCDTTVTGSVTGAAGAYNGMLTNADDTANATTPSASASGTQPAPVSRDITVNATLAVALNATSPDPALATARAVIGRTYGMAPQAPVVYDVTGGLPVYVITSSGTLLTDTNIACAAGATSATCSSAAGVTKSTPGTGATLTVSATDSSNSATPSGAASSAVQPFTIEALLALSANFNNPMPDAVQGRTYGGVGFTSLVYTASNGLGTYLFSVPASSGTPAAAFPTPMACAAGATTFTCSGAAITGTAGAYANIPVSADDTGNLTTPGSASAVATATVLRDLTVRPEFTITTVAAFLPGVVGRTYGNAPQSPQPVNTDVSATVGNAPLTSCTFTVTASNPGFNLTPVPVGTSCELSSGATLLTPAGAYNVSVAITDTVITDPVSAGTVVPAGTVDNAGAPLGLTVNAALAVALQTVPASPDPTTPAGQAVVGRTYGAPAGTDVVYEVSGGLPAYTITPTGTLLANTNIVCTAGATTATCNSGNVNVSNTGGTTPSLTISAADTANAATPAAAVAATKIDTWTVNPVITFSLAPAATGVVPNGAIPDGVVGQTYGTPLADLVFVSTGGLGNAAGFGLTGTQTGTLISNNITCAPAGAQVGATATVTCNSTAGGGVVTGPAGVNRTLVMTFSDAGNATTPAGSTSTDNAGYNNYSNTIAPALVVALQAGSPDPANVNAQAVVGRTYGAAPEAPVTNEVTGGLPPYGGSLSGTLLVNSNICAAPTVTATTLACHSGGVGVTGTTGVLTFTVNDTGSATTPASSAILTKTYTVNPALTMAVSPDPASPTTTAVIGRAYGIPAGLLSPTYTASGGLSLHAYAAGAPGAGITCTSGATPSECSSAAVTAVAPASFDVTVTDGGNLTTPADATGVTITRTFTVNAALVISTVTLRNGLVGFTYVPTGPGETLLTAGGLGGNTWVAPGGSGGGCAPAGVLPPGMALGAASGLLSGVPTAASPTVLDYAFDSCVFDTANATTPVGNATSSFTVNIMDTQAVVAAPGTNTVEVINTTTNSSVVSLPLATPASIPAWVAVTPNGRKAYVTLTAIDDVAVVDTISGAVSTIGGLGTCVGPRGIAIGLPGGLPTAFVACTNGEIAVIDAATDTFVGSSAFGTLGANFYGVAITSDDALVYVTDVGNDQFVVLDAISVVEIFGSPFAAGVTTPHGILISNDVARVYIAGSLSNDVNVLDASDNTTQVLGGTISTGGASLPESLASTPDGAHVYVTLNGANAFAVIADGALPALLGGNVTALGPYGITIPPLLGVPPGFFRVYITESGAHDVIIFDDETTTPFGIHSTPLIALPGVTPTPLGIAHIPVPR